jgi:hypothetical protein
MRRHAGARLTKVNALIAFYLSNAPLRANAAKGVTGYDQATLIWSGPGRPWIGSPTGTMHHVDVTPRQLMSPGPRHLAMSRWPWRLGLVAFGLTTAVLAALMASVTPVAPTVTATPGTHPRTAGRPSRAGNEVRVDPTTGPRESTTAPTLSTPPRHRAAGRQQADHHSWTGHGPSAGHHRSAIP